MKDYQSKHYLLRAELMWERVEDRAQYPFALPAIAGLNEITFHPKVTFIIGENGSGKSTLVEGLAVAWGFNAEGGSKNFNFGTFKAVGVFYVIPVLLLYGFFHKYLMNIYGGGSKG